MDESKSGRSRKMPTIPIYLQCKGCEGRLDIEKSFGANDTWMFLVKPCENCSIKTDNEDQWLETIELEKLKEQYKNLEKENDILKEENKKLKDKIERIDNILSDNEALGPEEVENAKIKNKLNNLEP